MARLALIIAEYQADVLYRGQKLALAEFLPLNAQNWITCGNALRLDWLSICSPTGTGVKHYAEDLFHTPLDQAQIDFENEGGETYICGNPPYRGNQWQTEDQKSDLKAIFDGRTKNWKQLDYVAGWFMKAADYGSKTPTVAAFVSTNSICQGRQVDTLWSLIFSTKHEIAFAHTSFEWANLASHNAGVTVVIVGISNHPASTRRLFSEVEKGGVSVRSVPNINGYLVPGPNVEVIPSPSAPDERAAMQFGNHTYYGVDLLLTRAEAASIVESWPVSAPLFRNFLGAREVTSGLPRKCLWMTDADLPLTTHVPPIQKRLQSVTDARTKIAHDKSAQALASKPHMFREQFEAIHHAIVMPAISSQSRPYLPADIISSDYIVGHKCYALYDAPLWNMALIVSRLHLVWIGTVCARMRTDFSYSNTLGWNTFPVPTLTDKNKADLTRCSEGILLAREEHFPATIADLYDPENMPADLREAHEHNDEVLERIYIGRRFRNDTERLEKLFELYTKMAASPKAAARGRARASA